MMIGLIVLGLISLCLVWKIKTLFVENSLLRYRASQVEDLLTKLQARETEIVELKVALGSREAQEDALEVICRHALEKNNLSFLELAKSTLERYQDVSKGELDKKTQLFSDLVIPVKEMLSRIDLDLKLIEKERKGEQEALKEQLKSLVETEKQLRLETSSLVRALKSPTSRGQWGELQLKRVVEIAGMINQCDFYEQKTFDTEEGKVRPDLIIRLPGNRIIVVDAKAPLDAYLEAINESNEQIRSEKLKDHARHVRTHIAALGKKSYWSELDDTPEFVVLFLPAETFFSAALEADPTLIEAGASQKVILATPTTLIALLKTVAYGWKEEKLSKHVEQVSLLAEELYKRLKDMSGSWEKMGRSLSQAVESYNKATGSLESRVMVTARKFKELGVIPHELEIPFLTEIEKLPKVEPASDVVRG